MTVLHKKFEDNEDFCNKNLGLTSRGRKLGRGNLPVVSLAAACRAARDPTVVHISADRWPPAPQSAGWTPAWPPGTGRLGSPGQLTEKNTLSPRAVLINRFQVLFTYSLEQLLSKTFGIGSQLSINVPLRPCMKMIIDHKILTLQRRISICL